MKKLLLLLAVGLSNLFAFGGIEENDALLTELYSGQATRESVKALIEAGADVNCRGVYFPYTQQILSYGEGRDMDVLKREAEEESCPFTDNVTPLALLLDYGAVEESEQLAIARLLVNHGADVNVTSVHWPSASVIMRKAHYGAAEMVKFLLDKGIDVDYEMLLKNACEGYDYHKKHCSDATDSINNIGRLISYLGERGVAEGLLNERLTEIFQADKHCLIEKLFEYFYIGYED